MISLNRESLTRSPYVVNCSICAPSSDRFLTPVHRALGESFVKSIAVCLSVYSAPLYCLPASKRVVLRHVVAVCVYLWVVALLESCVCPCSCFLTGRYSSGEIIFVERRKHIKHVCDSHLDVNGKM